MHTFQGCKSYRNNFDPFILNLRKTQPYQIAVLLNGEKRLL
jgi:hypothetical protein